MKRVHVENRFYLPRVGVRPSPCVLKTLHVIPWGTGSRLWLWFPRCLPSPSPLRPHPSFCLSCLEQSSRPVPLGSSAFPAKTKPFLTPDDQACSRFVWCVACAWVWWGRKFMLQFIFGVPASRGARVRGEEPSRSWGEGAQTIRLPERREKDHRLGVLGSLAGSWKEVGRQLADSGSGRLTLPYLPPSTC